MSQMLKSSGALSAATMVSRVLGMAREIAYAWFMGSSWVADAFTLAYMVPNLFRRLLGEGALTASFIPIFKEKEKTAGEAEMWQAANAVVSGLTLATTVLVAVGMAVVSLILFMDVSGYAAIRMGWSLGTVAPWLAGLCLGIAVLWSTWKPTAISSGRLRAMMGGLGVATAFVLILGLAGLLLAIFKEGGGGRILLMFRLLRVMFPYLVLVCVAAVFMGMLNARGHFFVPAMGATMLNLVMIASVVTVRELPWTRDWPIEKQIYGLAIGVLVAGIAQAGYQYPLLRRDGFRYRWVNPWTDPTVRRVAAQMIPGTIGVAAFQINVLVTQGLAIFSDAGVVSSFSYAVRLMELPQGVFGISLATYLLPTLSGFAAEKKYAEFRETLRHGVAWLLFANLLAAALLFTLAEPMVRLIFERAKFQADATLRSSSALTYLAPGLIAFSIVNILARAFYALGDTKTPMRISIFCLLLNIGVSVALVFPFREAGLAMANTATSLVNVSLLFYALQRKLRTLEMGPVVRRLPILFGIGVVAALVSWISARWWTAHLGHANFLLRLGEVFVPITLATTVYLGLNLALKTGYAEEMLGVVFARLRRGKKAA